MQLLIRDELRTDIAALGTILRDHRASLTSVPISTPLLLSHHSFETSQRSAQVTAWRGTLVRWPWCVNVDRSPLILFRSFLARPTSTGAKPRTLELHSATNEVTGSPRLAAPRAAAGINAGCARSNQLPKQHRPAPGNYRDGLALLGHIRRRPERPRAGVHGNLGHTRSRGLICRAACDAPQPRLE